jgi:uncharacterized HAD superfamily protein
MKTIAVDIDDVLAASAEGFVEFSNERWGTNLKVTDYDEHWVNMWQVSIEEVRKRTHEWYDAKLVTTYQPKDDAKEVLTKLAKRFKLVVATARAVDLQKDTLDWIDVHYKGVFSEVHHAGIWDSITMGKYNATKTELCKQIGADYLVDDQLKHCLSADEAGISAVLFGDYTWNQKEDLPQTIHRAISWNEVLRYFENK